jgi:hypothetical protein
VPYRFCVLGERTVPTTDSQKALAAVHDEAEWRDGAGETPSPAGPRTLLYIVVSPRPQVGKTFLARLLTDFLRLDGGSVRAFDVDTEGERLTDHLPDVAVAATVADIRGEMALFDRLILDDYVAKVVDLGAPAYGRFLTIMEEIGFIAECNRRGIEPTFLFAADEHPASIAAYAKLQQRFAGMLVVPVFNESITKGRQFRHRYPLERAASVPLRIPILASSLKYAVARSRCSFAELHDHVPVGLPSNSAIELGTWTRRAFLEFRELELRLLLEKLRTALPGVKL